MTIPRVTLLSGTAQTVSAIDGAASRLADVQSQMSSGKRITHAADDPAGTATAMGLRSSLAQSDQFATNSGDAIGWLSSADSAYAQSVQVLQKAQTLMVQAGNTGAADQNSQNAIATQLDGLRSTLLSIANTQYNGRPVFGGDTAGAAAYAADGSYVGTATATTRLVAPGAGVDVSRAGTDVFGSGSDDVFALLSSVASGLRAGTAPSVGQQDRLATALTRVGTAQAVEGGTYNQVQQLGTARTSATTAMTSQLGDIENVDVAETALRLASANTAYQASLQTAAAVNRQSLLDYLR